MRQLAIENVVALSEQNTSQVLYFINSSIGINSWQHCLLFKKSYTSIHFTSWCKIIRSISVKHYPQWLCKWYMQFLNNLYRECSTNALFLSLSCPSVWRWCCSTHFLVSTHVAPQSKGWGAKTATYCIGRSLPHWCWGLVGCVVDVCAYALLLPHQYVTDRMLPDPCCKLRAICLSPWPILQVCRKGSCIYLGRLNVVLKRFFWPPNRTSAAGEVTLN